MSNGWIFDISFEYDGLNLWVKEGDTVKKYHKEYKNSYFLCLPKGFDSSGLMDEAEALKTAKKDTFRTIYGEFQGWKIYSDKKFALELEKKTRYNADFYNLDVRTEQKYLAENNLSFCKNLNEETFSASIKSPLLEMTVAAAGKPHSDKEMKEISIECRGHREKESGDDLHLTKFLISAVLEYDPDVILLDNADGWMQKICSIARENQIFNSLSRTGNFRPLKSRSYFSYGKMEYKPSAMIPSGRIIIDSAQNFMYRQGGLSGVFLASRLTGISPNLTARFTPGTVVSNYEVFEALKKNICVPFRKSDAEMIRNSDEVRIDYRGGLILQPKPAVYECVSQLDFTSFYPSIIVKYNLSPETMQNKDAAGFLPSVIGPLLDFRIKIKEAKKTDSSVAGMDAMLKWMLVTCFGYTGYKNAKFGRIELHEKITTIATEILSDVCKISEFFGFLVLHGIVDCVFVQGKQGIDTKPLECAIVEKYKIPVETECYDWICFLPQKDGSGSYTGYYGRLCSGKIKIRGICARRKDMPLYVKKMQNEMLDLISTAKTKEEILLLKDEIREIYNSYYESVPNAAPADFLIRKQMGRCEYSKNCISASVIEMYKNSGAKISAGMDANFVVRDAARHIVDPEWNIRGIDVSYYRKLLDKAAEEIFFLFSSIKKEENFNPMQC